MDKQQAEVLADIQRLALAGAKQTGLRVMHSVRSDTYIGNGQVFVVSEIRILDRNLAELHKTSVQIDADGYDQPPTYLYLQDGADYGERTLAQQRDELAQWIASNRKQEAA